MSYRHPEYEPDSFHSQHMSNAPESGAHSGEDLWILEQFPVGYVGTALEAGALDGAYLSNTLLLEQKGWDVLCVEPNPRFRECLIANRKRSVFCGLSHVSGRVGRIDEDSATYRHTRSFVSLVGDEEDAEIEVFQLDELIEKSGFSKLDVLSLDTDGDEAEILACFTPERWGTTVMVLEVDGGEDDPVHLWALEHGFEKLAHLGHNYCYRRKS